MGGSAGLAGTAAAGQANPHGSNLPFVRFRPPAEIGRRPVTKFQQKMAALTRTGGTQGRIPNSAPPLILCRFWFYTTPLGVLWPWGSIRLCSCPTWGRFVSKKSHFT